MRLSHLEHETPSSIFREFLLVTFKGRRVHIDEIREIVKKTYPNLCDDQKLCEHETPPYRPEWYHKLRQVLDYLSNKAKRGERISHADEGWYEFP